MRSMRGTVEAPFSADPQVDINDWSMTGWFPLTEGRFRSRRYVDYIIEMMHLLGCKVHVVAG